MVCTWVLSTECVKSQDARKYFNVKFNCTSPEYTIRKLPDIIAKFEFWLLNVVVHSTIATLKLPLSHRLLLLSWRRKLYHQMSMDHCTLWIGSYIGSDIFHRNGSLWRRLSECVEGLMVYELVVSALTHIMQTTYCAKSHCNMNVIETHCESNYRSNNYSLPSHRRNLNTQPFCQRTHIQERNQFDFRNRTEMQFVALYAPLKDPLKPNFLGEYKECCWRRTSNH